VLEEEKGGVGCGRAGRRRRCNCVVNGEPEGRFGTIGECPGVIAYNGWRPDSIRNQTAGIVSWADLTARELTGDVYPLATRDIGQVSYCKDFGFLLMKTYYYSIRFNCTAIF
jgi:hypothetical protein